MIDDFKREALGMEFEFLVSSEGGHKGTQTDYSIAGQAQRDPLRYVPEYISHKLQEWAIDLGIRIEYINPGILSKML